MLTIGAAPVTAPDPATGLDHGRAAPQRPPDRRFSARQAERGETVRRRSLSGRGGDQPGALTGKTIYVSAGHGFTYSEGAWRTQRGNTHDLVEDLVSCEAVSQYLVPLLRGAGAHVVPLRELDLQRRMEIVDDRDPGYVESGDGASFSDSTLPGFGQYGGRLTGSGGPMQLGGNRLLDTAPAETARATWVPDVPADGRYNVYVTYTAFEQRASDAHYVVLHPGGETHFSVNQQRHGGTWVLLGNFWFAAGSNPATGAVVLINDSADVDGVNVSADAIRLGGGMGDIEGGGEPSGRPRWEEAGRYYTQWNGAPPSVWESGDVWSRPLFAAWDHDPGEDAAYISWHTNAFNGQARGTESYVYGPNPPNGSYDFTGTPGSDDMVRALHDELVADLQATIDPEWLDRGVNTAYFGEINPRNNDEMPAALLEIAFHDSEADAAELRSPRFRYVATRALMQGLITYFAQRDGAVVVLPPDVPEAVVARSNRAGGVTVSWDPPSLDPAGGDPPEAYIVYQSKNGYAYDDGVVATGTSLDFPSLPEGEARYFRVAARNAGGTSLRSHAVAVVPDDRGGQVLIVDGFFRLDGRQLPFEDLSGYGLGTVDRMILSRMNDGQYVRQYAPGLAGEGLAVESASDRAVESGRVALDDYQAVIWFVGRETTGDEPLSPTARAPA